MKGIIQFLVIVFLYFNLVMPVCSDNCANCLGWLSFVYNFSWTTKRKTEYQL